MQEINRRFKIELDTFFEFLEKKYPETPKCWDIMYVEDDFAYIVFVFELAGYEGQTKKVLGTFSLNNSSAFEPAIDLGAYRKYIEKVATEFHVSHV